MKIVRRLVFVLFLLVTLTFSACTPATPPPSSISPKIETPTEPPMATDTSEPTKTVAPTQTSTPLPPTLTPIPEKTADGLVTAGSMNLRQGPGTTFLVVTRLAQNTRLVVLGKARGDEWVLVDTGKNKGWLAVEYVDMPVNKALNFLPIIDVPDGFIIHGKVADTQGIPVNGIGFAITFGSGPKVPRTDAVTMEDGSFYAYLPKTASGNWDVSLVSFSCKSRIMDTDCKHSGNIDPVTTTITLPSGPELIFTYRNQ